MGDHQPSNTAWIHFGTCRFAACITQILCYFPPIVPHWSSLVISENVLRGCKLYTLSFSFKISWSKNDLFFLSTGYAGQACLKVWVLIASSFKYPGFLSPVIFSQFLSCERKELQPSPSTELVFFIIQPSLQSFRKRCLHSPDRKENKVYPKKSLRAED